MNLPSAESILPPRERSISPQSLIADNLQAKQYIKEWQDAKEKPGGLTLFIVCSDARIVTAKIFGKKTVASISSISGATDLSSFEKLLRHDSIGQIVVVGHFDHQTIKDGEAPGGCGGHKVSQKIQQGEVIPHSGLQEFATEQISPDFFDQIIKKTEQAMLISGKPVLGVAVDHLTNAAIPIIELLPNKKPLIAQNIDHFQWKKISDELLLNFLRFGSDLFPEIKLDDLSGPFREFISRNRGRIEKEIRKNPKIVEKQKVQNPSTVVVSTSPIPLALRYPKNFGQQNQAFVIRQSFVKKDTNIAFDDANDFVQDEIAIKDIDFNLMAAQLYYPISHAITATIGQDFRDTTNILVETPNIELSSQIALELSKMDFVKQWMNQRGGKIILTEVESGKTVKAVNLSEIIK